METMTMVDLYKTVMNRRNGELILDVRDPEEYAAGHVPGSRNIPYDRVEEHLSELKGFERIYIHCQSGGRASLAMDSLRKRGFRNLVCIGGGGMGDWIKAGLPVEK